MLNENASVHLNTHYTHTSGMSLMSPVLGLPGPHPGPQNRTQNLFFHPSISLNLSIMYLRYPNYQIESQKIFKYMYRYSISCNNFSNGTIKFHHNFNSIFSAAESIFLSSVMIIRICNLQNILKHMD